MKNLLEANTENKLFAHVRWKVGEIIWVLFVMMAKVLVSRLRWNYTER